MPEPSNSLDLSNLLMGLLGGLALFLFGMRLMTEALKTVAGERMKKLLACLTRNRFTGMLAGTLVTAVIQSSSVTTVLVVGFVSAHLMGFSQSIGVIIGANIGTTITAQIIAFKITHYALLFIGIGFLVESLGRNERQRQVGEAVMGLGMLFFGMSLMSQAMSPLRDHPSFVAWMQTMDHTALALASSALFTALIQSSSATTGLVIILAGEGLISLDAGIAMVMGSNVGTCVTAMLSAIGKPREATRVAVAHVAFNVFGVLLFYWWIPLLADFARWMSPEFLQLEGAARRVAEAPRQIANAHTLFNLANAAIFIWFTGPLASLIRRWIPDPPNPEPFLVTPRFVDDYYLDTPAMALERVRLEQARMAHVVLEMLEEALPTLFHPTPAKLAHLSGKDDAVDTLYSAIVRFLGLLSQQPLVSPHTERLAEDIAITNHLEAIGDVLETEWVGDGEALLRADARISQATQAVVTPLYDKVHWAFATVVATMEQPNSEALKAVIQSKKEVKLLAAQANLHLSKRLATSPTTQLPMFRIESEIVEHLKRIHDLTRRIAKVLENPEVLEPPKVS